MLLLCYTPAVPALVSYSSLYTANIQKNSRLGETQGLQKQITASDQEYSGNSEFGAWKDSEETVQL